MLDEDPSIPCLAWVEGCGRPRRVIAAIDREVGRCATGARTSRARSQDLLTWIWGPGNQGSEIDVRSFSGEWRNRSPEQVLHSGTCACREINVLFISGLRASGVRARHCTVGRWFHREGYHFFTGYYDSEIDEWTYVDTSDDRVLVSQSPKGRVEAGRWNSLVYYAYPGNPEESDLYGKGRWDKMVRITGGLAEEFPMVMVWPDAEQGGTLSAQIWNGGSWRTILIQEVKAGERPVVVNFGKTHVTTRPVMFSADIGGERYLAMVKAAALDHKVVLEKVEGGSPWLGRRVRSQRR